MAITEADSWFLGSLITYSGPLPPHVNNIELSFRPVTLPGRVFTEPELFWSIPDRATPSITYEQYSAAFLDVSMHCIYVVETLTEDAQQIDQVPAWNDSDNRL